VWREFALRGPQARLPLLLERVDDRPETGTIGSDPTSTSSTSLDPLEPGGPLGTRRHPTTAEAASVVGLAIDLEFLAEAELRVYDAHVDLQEQLPPRWLYEAGVFAEVRPWYVTSGSTPLQSHQRFTAAALGDWVRVQADLADLVRLVLPFTSWAPAVADLARLAVQSPTQLVALLGHGLRDGGEIGAWLGDLLPRLWGYDSDLVSERPGAADALAMLLRRPPWVLEPSFDPLAPGFRPRVQSISLDRQVAPSVSVSRKVVKADAVRRVFDLDCSKLTWAVIDTGIDARHPAFWGADGRLRITKAIDFGAIDDSDLRAHDMSSPDPVAGLAEVVDHYEIPLPANRGADSLDAWQERAPARSHGTHVAGILAGNLWPTGTNADGTTVEEGVLGLCPDLRLWDLRVCSRGETAESRVLMALRYLRYVNGLGQQLQICGVNISLSMAYDPSERACGWTPVCVEVRRLVRSGVVVVVSAGNEGWTLGAPASSMGRGYSAISITDPGNAEEAITVGATHRRELYKHGVSYFSSRGPTADGRRKPDILAPGDSIESCVGMNGVRKLSGTSQAAPHVSAAAAMLMARNEELIGQPERVKQILCSSASDLGRDPNFQGTGCLDILRAFQSV
jgi:hypothetical protein